MNNSYDKGSPNGSKRDRKCKFNTTQDNSEVLVIVVDEDIFKMLLLIYFAKSHEYFIISTLL